MAQQLEATVDLINDKVRFAGQCGSNAAITMDYTPPLGDGEGYMPLELLLLSLSACSGATVVTLLRRMKRTVTGLRVHAEGTRRDAHPTSFETISLEFVVSSADAQDSDVQKAIQLSEETYCPVWAMVRNNAEIGYTYTVNRS